MTVVAWDGKTLAADKQATSGEVKVTATKIHKLNDGCVVATTGDIEAGLLLVEWYKNGANRDDWPESQKTDNWARLIVLNRYGLFEYEKQCVPQKIADKFAAFGCGREAALGAMAAGANAEQAVLIASRFNIYCGMGVDSFQLS